MRDGDDLIAGIAKIAPLLSIVGHPVAGSRRVIDPAVGEDRGWRHPALRGGQHEVGLATQTYS